MNKPLILMVEDDKAIRKLITTTLGTQGYQYPTAETGEGSILEAVSRRSDIMILDLGFRTWTVWPLMTSFRRSYLMGIASILNPRRGTYIGQDVKPDVPSSLLPGILPTPREFPARFSGTPKRCLFTKFHDGWYRPYIDNPSSLWMH